MKKLFDGNEYRVDRFKQIDDPHLSNEERRKLELELLRPEPLPEYSGKMPSPNNMKPTHHRILRVSLRSDEELELVESILGVGRSKDGFHIRNVSKLVQILTEYGDNNEE